MSISVALAALPDTAPFPADEIRQLNALLAGTSALQRSWLSGFLAGFDAAAPANATPPAAKPKLTILFATESGNAEALAAQARQAAARQGFAATVLDMADTTPDTLVGLRNLIVIASTWGEGEPPQRAAAFHTALMAETAPRLETLRYAVLALGDRAYAQFCAVGHAIDARLAALGAERAAPLLACDLDFETPALAWITATLKTLAPERPEAEIIQLEPRRHSATQGHDRAHPFSAELGTHVNLHSSRSSAETVHMEISLAGSGIAYEPGDALAVLPQNDPEEVARLLAAAGLASESALAETLAETRDITTLTLPMLNAYAEISGDIALHALVRDEAAATAYVRSNRPRDLLGQSQAPLAPEQLLGLLRPLAPRYYSIASSRKAVGEQADLLVARLRFPHGSEIRHGVASHYLTQMQRPGDTLKLWLKPNPHFRLPADPDRPILMIGPGTGVAPFRGFVQERRETGARGKAWLFFGHRNFTHDFLYQLEWQDALKDGSLSAIDLAFSRDQPEKFYVQDRLWQRREAVQRFIADGAVIYICGDRGMAAAVETTLGRIFDSAGGQGEAAVAQLQREGRLLKDAY